MSRRLCHNLVGVFAVILAVSLIGCELLMAIELEEDTEYVLDVTIDGNGSVAIDPDQPSYAQWTVVELTAIPDIGWVFSNWSGDASGSENPTYVSIDINKNITAVFVETTP